MNARLFLQGFIAFLIVAFGQPSFAPWLAPISAAAGYALFWHCIRIYPFKFQRFWRGVLWYGCVSLIQLSWMTSIEYQGIYILCVLAALCIWLGVQFGLLSLFVPYNRTMTLPRILAMASFWTLLEWSRFYVLCGFSWNPSGIALSHPYSLQLACIFGVLGLSFWVIFVNLLGLRALKKKGLKYYGVWAFAAAFPYLFGLGHGGYHKTQMMKQENQKSLSCVLVQTGLLPPEKVPLQGKFHSFISPYDQWKRILYFLKDQRKNHPELIVFPEAALPFSSNQRVYETRTVQAIFHEVFGNGVNDFPQANGSHVSNTYWVQAISNIFESEVIIGLDHVDENKKAFNSAFHALPHVATVNRYDKRVLMPLAEYLPFNWVYSLVKNYGITSFFTRGKEATVFQGKIPMSVSICYEETFPSRIREGRLNGAQLLVNVTNDGWYPFSKLPSQHFEHAKFRSVENGTALIRSCNTGVTCVVDSLGRCLGKMEESGEDKHPKSGALFVKLNTYSYPTLFTFWGNWGIVSLSTGFLAIFFLLRRELFW